MYLLDDNMSLYRMYFCILVLQNTFSHTSMLYFIWIHFMKILFGVFVPISDKKCYDGLIMPLSWSCHWELKPSGEKHLKTSSSWYFWKFPKIHETHTSLSSHLLLYVSNNNILLYLYYLIRLWILISFLLSMVVILSYSAMK